MDDVVKLAVFSVTMLCGSYLSGSVPLAFSLSESKLQYVSAFGAGLLIGAALIVIIPEGVELLVEDAYKDLIAKLSSSQSTGNTEVKGPGLALKETDGVLESSHSHNGVELPEIHMMMGLALILGFVFMLIIDQFGRHSHASTISEDDVIIRTKRKHTATIGLIVHAAADGIALGAAASASKTDVEFVIFLAIMLHKAPAAFGLTSFLLHEGFDRTSVRIHLLVFSLAAPLLAFVSYFGLGQLLRDTGLPMTGLTMLFSAGTFLYVATVHVLNEITEGRKHRQTMLSDASNSRETGLTRGEMYCIILGSLLPLLFNIIHSH